VTGHVRNLQVKVVDLEAKMVPSTPQDVRDQRDVDAKSVFMTMSTIVEKCERLLSDTA